ncbi:MAG: PGF-pre-PGF domain-containing protein, partial [Methanoregulaceae archaeon]
YSLVGENFNSTQTTDWSTIADFRAVPNLTFVIENATSHALLGNISYNQDLDLTASGIGNGLAVLGANLNMAAAGNSVNLTVANSDLQAFNKSATLTVYPTGFAFSSGADIKITATTDAGTATVLYNNGAWITRNGFVDASRDVSVGSGNISLPVLHFSKFDFDKSSVTGGGGGSGGGSGGGGGGGGGSSTGYSGAGSSGTMTVSAPIGGNSAMNTAKVTGVGLTNLAVTATTQPALPASIPSPATDVYQYIEVTPAYYTQISNALITFTVQKSWLAERGYTENDIVLMRYSDGGWVSLVTRIISENDAFVTYQAETRGFSYFAIAYLKSGTTTTPLNETQSEIPTGTIPAVASATGGIPEIPTTGKTSGFDTGITIAAIAALSIGTLATSRKK